MLETEVVMRCPGVPRHRLLLARPPYSFIEAKRGKRFDFHSRANLQRDQVGVRGLSLPPCPSPRTALMEMPNML